MLVNRLIFSLCVLFLLSGLDFSGRPAFLERASHKGPMMTVFKIIDALSYRDASGLQPFLEEGSSPQDMFTRLEEYSLNRLGELPAAEWSAALAEAKLVSGPNELFIDVPLFDSNGHKTDVTAVILSNWQLNRFRLQDIRVL